MKKSDASVTAILGMRGSGKSTLTRSLADSHPRRVIFDIMKEWNGPFYYARTFDEFANHWRDHSHDPSFTIVVRFPEFSSPETIIELQTQITKLVYLTGQDSETDVCMIFEEAQFYFPNQGLHPVNMHLFTTGRHAHISIIANSQRPALITKLLLSQSEEIYVGKLYEANDIAYLRDCVGDLAFQARELQSLHFIYYPVGHPENIGIVEL